MKKTLTLIAVVMLMMAPKAHGQAHQTLPWQQMKKSSAHQQTMTSITPLHLFQKNESLATKQRFDSLLNELFQTTWSADSKQLYTYDAQQRIAIQNELTYDNLAGVWVPQHLDSITYYSNGLQEKKSEFFWDAGLNQWIGNNRDVWVYDISGKILNQTSYMWDQTLASWIPTGKGDFSYNANNMISNILWSYYNTDSSAWYNGSKEERTYNANQELTLAMFYYWDDQTMTYQPGSKDEYTWNANGKISTMLSSMFDAWLLQWVPEFKEEYTYDAQGNNTLLIYQQYDWGTQQMVPNEKHEKSFSANHNLLSDITSYYNQSSTTWEMSTKTTYTFNDTYALNDLILPFGADEEDIPEIFNHMVTAFSQYSYNSTTTAWDDVYRGTLYYSPQVVSSVIENEPAMARVYPNPAGNTVNIEVNASAKLEITDLKGSLVYREILLGTGCHLVDHNLKPGLYLYTIVSENQSPVTGKLIIL
jgi:hypothetical protein